MDFILYICSSIAKLRQTQPNPNIVWSELALLSVLPRRAAVRPSGRREKYQGIDLEFSNLAQC